MGDIGKSPEIERTPEVFNPRSRVEWMVISRKENFVKYRYIGVEGRSKDCHFRNTAKEEMDLFEAEVRRWGNEGRVGWMQIIY